MTLTPPFPDRVREMMREYLVDEGFMPAQYLDILVTLWRPDWREAWSMAQRSRYVAEIRARQGHRWKRALYGCAVEEMNE